MSKRQASDTQANYLPDEATILATGDGNAAGDRGADKLHGLPGPERDAGVHADLHRRLLGGRR